MPGGVVFLVCIPTLSYEHQLVFGVPVKRSKKIEKSKNKIVGPKVDLRLKETKSRAQLLTLDDDGDNEDDDVGIDVGIEGRKYPRGYPTRSKSPVFVSMETVLEELLKKLRVEHVVWCKDKEDMYYEVIFPVPAGEPCENCIHCLTELGIGVKMNSIVSVIPTQCTYSGVNGTKSLAIKDDVARRRKESEDRKNAWDDFVGSIRSKLTVKQVVDGVRSGGDLTFDYMCLVLTADCLAALGLIENSATNVVAAMLVSPLMGPVMSLTFGTIIADRKLQLVGLKSLMLGIFVSILFGFIFGLLLGTTEMPWGYGDWPTDEMKGRGNYRSLWMGVLWALPSGTGVAVALLQGSNGPLIGVAISASLLPPVVNCGLFWALGCIWLIYRPIKMPHIKGESYTNFNSSYTYIYSDYLPVEFFCNGIISACLTFINVMCIFITAIIVLKIKEVAAPYTSTPELRRFWEHDIRLVRDKNISRDNSSLNSSFYDGLSKTKQRALERTLNEAVREAINDETFRKVQRLSYGHGPEEISPRLGLPVRGTGGRGNIKDSENTEEITDGNLQSHKGLNSGNTSEDLIALDRLITYLLSQPSNPTGGNLDSWRRSHRASSRGYRQLRGTAADTDAETGRGVGTTTL
ncbi:PREDICTED: uncharacterized protein LOC105154195 [Acromyrmex echinatior]|uniref:Uncharacterized protein n=1 Tax=Acromyrmex echinatior TaxID=103372 RepID=F4W457_ACREC|nr:PREDICTED: uncharacterized protein LOC105154195 [Acromyrmex echinatior]EGI71053.1 Uncharacterized protein G5I_00162 [Acromyrmex echinatior]